MGERDRHHGALLGTEGVAMNLYVAPVLRGDYGIDAAAGVHEPREHRTDRRRLGCGRVMR